MKGGGLYLPDHSLIVIICNSTMTWKSSVLGATACGGKKLVTLDPEGDGHQAAPSTSVTHEAPFEDHLIKMAWITGIG